MKIPRSYGPRCFDDVVWIEGDRDLGERSYNGKPDVLQHVEDVKRQLVLVTFKSVTVQGQRGTTKDEMTVRGHQKHECERCITACGTPDPSPIGVFHGVAG